jgi:hypothetical protein
VVTFNAESHMSFETLLQQLPSLAKAPISPWNATTFLRWTCSTGMSHGELLAARLVLTVWNPDTDWVAEAKNEKLESPLAAKRFDMVEAATVWDAAHLKALATWLTSANKFP